MNEVAKALYDFWSSFGLNACVEGYVPDEWQMPYITYSLTKPEWRSQGLHYARVWYRDTSYNAISEKLKEIEDRIGDGYSIPTDSGFICIYKDSQFIQFQPDEDVTVKIAYLSLILEANC